ncbi:methyltransferase domain-containing protein [Saccharomonospora xinjiangensis]|uniref:class I SAM-dependent methyltransferase n=1 Tax=Saccharomonospora xinjiangensis TaxID=75294 RepID=UPI00106F88BA|nr:methyltransferase domain-containing protein [Saccharomonospora xinjiangensis]QBQ62423.1 Methyltransferase domain protein [Saccharomonospora xinjiangensis]
METTHTTSATPASRLAFLREASRTQRTTGAIAPSSARLAARLAEPLALERRRSRRRLSVLEVGAGTGSVTRTLARLSRQGDRLDVVELNPRFVDLLGRAMVTDPVLSTAPGDIRLLAGSITELELGGRYDVIVSCLPFANFEPGQVREIMDRYLSLLVPGGRLSYFRYLGARALRTVLPGRAEAVRYRSVATLLAGFESRYGAGGSVVWGNLPPARVVHLRSARIPAIDAA